MKMTERIALKRLTDSDLTFFEVMFRKLNAGNQKAINLNADIFIEKFYPTLPALKSAPNDVIPVTLTILGPKGVGPHIISRAVTKRQAYKNWRLNGEFVRDPEDEPGRYDELLAGDLALFEFFGDPRPERVSLLLISANDPTDADLHHALAGLVPGGRKTMVELSKNELSASVGSAPAAHPVWQFTFDPQLEGALEDAASGGFDGIETLRKKANRKFSAEEISKSRRLAEEIGQDGEELAWLLLQQQKSAGTLNTIEWSSHTNAIAPYDFSVTDAAGSAIVIDAKSTAGSFDRKLHISYAELLEAANRPRYDIWRIYDITDEGAKVRIAENVGSFAKTIISSLTLPDGVTADSFSISPTKLSWGVEQQIERLGSTED
ncbi:DUF3883 domain-containing protein [Rhodopseudomonas palustris]|uniref:DUF3883 domain-containing protein n=1 Tax=Rhodopseudomonas palustris TaxID=1076 RepID=UPI000CECD368|nr:DUF3883 domain-containing protein [Rhodopseudomonas palustris]PPQ43660.1 hypothetical protein CKO39_10725 [Rhodopseudomonas palustris]